MSSNGSPNSVGQPNGNAIDVSFSSVTNRNGESSKRASSHSSEKKSHRSDRSHEQSKKEDVRSTESSGRHSDGGDSGNGRPKGHRTRKSGGFLLDSVLGNGSPATSSDARSKRKAPDGSLDVGKRRPASHRFSGESSMRSSPLSNQVSMDGSTAEEGNEQRQQQQQRASNTPAMDPTQLVQMALNLSESRKRHVSNSLHVPLPAGRRVSSSNYGTLRSASTASNRSSPYNDSAGRKSESPEYSMDHRESIMPDLGRDNVVHTFSPATLARAEKARKYFELASEYRRLLDHLPPLKPDSSAPGNYTFESKSSPGSAFPQIIRVPTNNDEKHALGRSYDPIQALRNRRVRIRERRPFTAPPNVWQDVHKVSYWINDVESAIEDENFRLSGDRVDLPPYPDEEETSVSANKQSIGKHRRTDTAGSLIAQPENSWTIEPGELLADLYWTEKNDNKYYVETKHGNPIFTQPPRRSMDTPRISVEMHREIKGGLEDGTTASDTESKAKPDRRRKLMLPLKDSEKRKHRRILSRSSSESSNSSIASAKARRLREGRFSLEEDIAPLKRHMQDLIDKDERGELTSPELVSPDHWDSRNMRYGKGRPSLDQPHRESSDRVDTRTSNKRASLDVPRHDFRRSRSADGRIGSLDKAMSSVESVDSDANTSARPSFESAVNVGTSQSSKKRPGSGRKLSKSKLPMFRSKSKERRGIEEADFADVPSSDLYTIMSADSERPRKSYESGRPHVFARHRTNESFDSTLQRNDTASTNGTVSSSTQGGSTVGRFFKGGRDRIGGLVSDRFRTRDRSGTTGAYDIPEAVAEASDTDGMKPMNGNLKKRMTEPSSADISPRASFDRGRARPKFHVSGLPSFTPSARDKRARAETPDSSNNDGSSKQNKEGQDGDGNLDSSRLVPPRIGVVNASDTEGDTGRIKWAKGYGELDSRATSASRGSPFPSGMPRDRNRHWSIYDKLQPQQAKKVSQRDIARVQALLLASGIKAREIQRRSDSPRNEAPALLSESAKIAGEKIGDLPAMKDEHLVASDLLTTFITASFTSFERSIAEFQSQVAKTLQSSTSALHSKASDQLSKLVHETSDEADAFTVELTTRGPRDTKQVLDAVDAMFQMRRRQFRMLLNIGFKLLEWLLLGIMWGIWFVVVIFNMGKRVALGVGRFARWLVVF